MDESSVSFSDVARMFDCPPRVVPDLLYNGHLKESEVVVWCGRRRRIRTSRLDLVKQALIAAGKISAEK